MSILIDKDEALSILLAEAAADTKGEPVPPAWEKRIEALSKACDKGSSKTHIAFLGTALLAKATDVKADAYSVKEGAPSQGAYSARGLGHAVLVPNAPALGLHLGVTGREPLNNQPYFRIQRATLEAMLPLVREKTPVHRLLECLDELDKVKSSGDARLALRAYIHVRRTYQPAYPTAPKVPPKVTPSSFVTLVEKVVGADAEGGKRAQAVAAGVLDAVEGTELVLVARINDPDRHFPGDVGVRREAEIDELGYAIEVRDKKVTGNDLLMFARKLAEKGVHRGAVLAVANGQPKVATDAATAWAEARGVYLVVFFGWGTFLEQALFWSAKDAVELAVLAHERVRERLEELEASPESVTMWDDI